MSLLGWFAIQAAISQPGSLEKEFPETDFSKSIVDFDESVLDFGTTGRLRMSDLLMYDRQTETWWQQFTGQALIGEYAGRHLEEYPANIVAFEDFRERDPEGPVLSRRTGHSRLYGENPYRGYDRIDQSPFMFEGETDSRLPPMERVLAVRLDDESTVYPFGAFDGP